MCIRDSNDLVQEFSRDVFRFGNQDVLTPLVNIPLQICWQSALTPSTGDSGWSIPVGTLTLTGPSGQDAVCTLGLRCRIQLAGAGWGVAPRFAGTNGIRLMNLSVPCGTKQSPTSDFSDPGSPYQG